VGPRAGLDTEARGKILAPLPRIEPRSPGRPDPSQTLDPELHGTHEKNIVTNKLICLFEKENRNSRTTSL
jgi:hypothetical protein